MALDGIVISNLVYELNNTILGKHISKIAQPEPDELLFTIKGDKAQYRLDISASASLPFVYLTDKNKPGPLAAPNFCMVLRKHIQGGRIVSISQPHMERIINIEIEHLDEMGDLCRKTLVVELMGKHSNIIFCNSDGMIIDSIKHVSSVVSSVREVLPGRTYCIAATQEDKINPLGVTEDLFLTHVANRPMTVSKAIYTSFTGISPLIANEICHRALVDADMPTDSLNDDAKTHLYNNFRWMMDDIAANRYTPNIVNQKNKPVDFSSVVLTEYSTGEYTVINGDSVSHILEEFYAAKNVYTRIRQKSVDLRKIINTSLERSRKKYDIQLKQLKDTEKRDKYRVYGELIHTYGYGVNEGANELVALNYYTNEDITIPLDPTIDVKANAQKYFDRYNKLKRTYEALSELIKETQNEIEHLKSILASLDIAVSEDDLAAIREELTEYGYIRRRSGVKKAKLKSRPFHYISSDGYHMYVGKNNYQNDELTFRMATGNDWWFHAKGRPGSHVIVKANNEELPDRTFEEAGRLAGYYSSGRDSDKIEIDYLQKKNIKKPNGSAPGFVVYYTNYSLTIDPDISGLTLIDS